MRAPLPLLVLAILLVPATAGASEVVAPPGSVWTVHTTVDAIVRDNYATVKVIADIRNQGPDPEFPFVVRVPDDAFVTGLTIERDGVVHEAQVKGREEARAEYEEWKAQEQTGGLVEKARRTDVYSYLINVAEFTNVRATLTYERYLAADRGVYNLSLEAPVSGFGRDLGASFHVRVIDSDGVVALWGDAGGESRRDDCWTPREMAVCQPGGQVLTYEVGPRSGPEPTPFTASYTLAPTADAGTLLVTIVDGQGYFAHRFRATGDAQELPMDLVLVLDTSGSMAGLKMRQMVDSAKQVVGTLRDDDRLHLVAFSSQARASWSGLLEMTPENRRKAVAEIDALFDAGGTNIEDGLRRGFAGLEGIGDDAGRFPALVLLTDGVPTSGVTSRPELLALAERLNEPRIPVFGIAFGQDADWTLIRGLSEENEGAAIRVPQGVGAEVDLRRFLSMLTAPVLRDVAIEYRDGDGRACDGSGSCGVVARRTGAPVLFSGSELLVVGTFDPEKGISGVVTGHAPDGARNYTFDAPAAASLPFLPRLVAYHEVRVLQESDAPDVDRIVALALEHSFVTDHTSLVLTLPAQEARPFDATQGDRRASWDNASTASSAPVATKPMATGDGGYEYRNLGSGSAGEAALTDRNDVRTEAEPDAYASPRTGAPHDPPQAEVPAAGLLLVALALIGAALVLGRRK